MPLGGKTGMQARGVNVCHKCVNQSRLRGGMQTKINVENLALLCKAARNLCITPRCLLFCTTQAELVGPTGPPHATNCQNGRQTPHPVLTGNARR